jgi:dynein heavy chain
MNVEHDDMFVKDKIMFGDLLKLDAPVKLYEEIKDKAKLTKVLTGMLDDYNIGNSNKMNLVFFDDAIEHILRIGRVLRQPRGNIMLIGVGGSGK